MSLLQESQVGRILRPVTVSDNGPERFSFRLTFEKRRSDGIITSVAVMVSDVSWDLTGGRHLMIEVLVRLKAKLHASQKVYKRCLTDDGSIIVQAYKNTNRDAWRPLVVSLKVIHQPGRPGLRAGVGRGPHYDVMLQVFAVAPTGKEALSATSRLAGGLDAVRRSGSLCDVVISVDGTDFRAHRVVLAANSEVFHRMLTGDSEFKVGPRKDWGKKAFSFIDPPEIQPTNCWCCSIGSSRLYLGR